METIFKFISIPMGYVIRFLYSLIPNYLVAILLFAFIIKALLFPLGIKQQKNMVKQAGLRPKEAAIRKKYAGRNDKVTQQKMQQEIMDLYQQENYNPMSGCLPLLLQLPIIYSLYFVIRGPLTYICRLSADSIETIRNAITEAGIEITKAATEIDLISIIRDNGLFDKVSSAFEGTAYTSIEKLPDFRIGSFDLGVTPSFAWNIYLIIPVLTFVLGFISQKLLRKFQYTPAQDNAAGGCSNKSMDLFFPLFSVWITFLVPSIIGIYYIAQNLLGTLQQFILKCMYPYPEFTEEDMKAAEKEILGTNRKSNKKAHEADPNRPKVRSLHHIDDEEYAAAASQEKSDEKPRITERTGVSDENALIGKAKLKDDEKDGH